VLIDAVARAREVDPSIRLCVVGDARGIEESLVERCRSLGQDGNITFSGAVPPDSVPAAISAMDIVVAPYPKMDTFYFSPLKIYEYMAAGKPIIASSIGQISDVLEHEVNALLVPPGDAEALAAALLRLRDDTDLGARLGAAAAAEVADNHTWRRRVLDVIGIMEQLNNKRAVNSG
jgi:glycosyltransferase involved in cell wall biosynthesis